MKAALKKVHSLIDDNSITAVTPSGENCILLLCTWGAPFGGRPKPQSSSGLHQQTRHTERISRHSSAVRNAIGAMQVHYEPPDPQSTENATACQELSDKFLQKATEEQWIVMLFACMHKAGANINQAADDGRTPLLAACAAAYSLPLVEEILKNGGNVKNCTQEVGADDERRVCSQCNRVALTPAGAYCLNVGQEWNAAQLLCMWPRCLPQTDFPGEQSDVV